MSTGTYLAIDLGAESGRAVIGRLDRGYLSMEELHRFGNGPVRVFGNLYWDALRLYQEIRASLGQAGRRCDGRLDGIGIDTWGVDFGLIAADGSLLGHPHHYRDRRTEGMLEEAFALMPAEQIFEQTGIQFMRLNTIFQLLAMVRAHSPLLGAADRLLMMAGLFNYLLTGRAVAEFTLASTTQLYDPRSGSWARPIFEALGLPIEIMPEVIEPGSQVGPLLDSIRRETGLQPVPVLAPACHDTGSAIAAVPATGSDWAYISSGTWALLGAEIDAPLITPQVRACNFTNEGGVGGTIRFLKNIAGLWLLQECRRTWLAQGQDHSYPELTELAAKAPAFTAFVNPDEEAFSVPGDMPTKIRDFCRRSGQSEPGDKGQVVRCILESLAMRFRQVLGMLEGCLGRRQNVIHVVGGGSQNDLLNQMTADACDRPVVAGPVEATAIGNLLMQAVATGRLGSVTEAREVVARSFELRRFEPADTAAWDQAFERYSKLVP